MKIACVVILYNYEESIIKNIKTYSNFCEKIYAIDNSDKEIKFKDKLIEIQNLKYIKLDGNKGISVALNVGIEKAISEGYKWVLTMDQDSFFKTNLLVEYNNIIQKYSKDNIAIIAPNYNFDRRKLKKYKGYKEVSYTMQSANLINTEIWEKIGGFKENLFIDVVDYEYCLRCCKFGYKILQCGEAILEHQPAITRTKKILAIKLKYGYCAPIRIYYQARNLLWTAKKYHSIRMFAILLIKLAKIILLFDNKKEFFKMYIKGIKDSKKL